MPIAAMPVDVSATPLVATRPATANPAPLQEGASLEHDQEALVTLVAPQQQLAPQAEAPRSLTFDVLWAEAAEIFVDDAEHEEESSEEASSSTPAAAPQKQRSEPQIWQIVSPFIGAAHTASFNVGDPVATQPSGEQVADVEGQFEGRTAAAPAASPDPSAIDLPEGVQGVGPTKAPTGEIAFSAELQVKTAGPVEHEAAPKSQPPTESKLSNIAITAPKSSQAAARANAAPDLPQVVQEQPQPAVEALPADPAAEVAGKAAPSSVPVEPKTTAARPASDEDKPVRAAAQPEKSSTAPTIAASATPRASTSPVDPAKAAEPAIPEQQAISPEKPVAERSAQGVKSAVAIPMNEGEAAPQPQVPVESEPAEPVARAVKPAATMELSADGGGEERPSSDPDANANGAELASRFESGARPNSSSAQTPKPAAVSAAAPVQPVATETEPAGRIELQLRGENNNTANVSFSDRGGQVQVTVRAPDPGVVHALRAELQQLSASLEGQGYQVKMSTPSSTIGSRDVDAGSADASATMHDERASDQQQGQRNPRHRNGQEFNWYEESE